MSRLSRFRALSGRQQALLLQAIALLATIRLGLTALPFGLLRKALAQLVRPITERGTADDRAAAAAQAVWAVETAGRYFPAIGTCLTQALAAHVLLGRAGQPSGLRIGVRRDPNGKFVAHAWLEQAEVILIGGSCHSDYIPMPAMNGLVPSRVDIDRVQSATGRDPV